MNSNHIRTQWHRVKGSHAEARRSQRQAELSRSTGVAGQPTMTVPRWFQKERFWCERPFA
jgi:hypothetical protein